jgi:hypothetical protein
MTFAANNAIHYPSGDRQPETFAHLYAILMTIEVLRLYLQGQQATVLGNQFLYYCELQSRFSIHFVFHELTGNRAIVNRCSRRRTQPDQLRQLFITAQHISSPPLKPMLQHIA